MKISSNNQQLNQLNKEKSILETIQRKDQVENEKNQFIVKWLYPSQFLSHNSNNNNNNNNKSNESIYLLNEEGDFIPSPLSSLNGLVFEHGEMNLNQYMTNNSRIPEIEKIHILEQIVKSVSFVHKHNIVHFDLKPENIVLFHTNNSGSKWKLIDFDSSYDLNISSKLTNNSVVRLTEEYVSPEVMKFINSNNNNNNEIINEIEINDKMDIWSLGLISIFLFKGCNVWRLLYPQRQDFEVSMLLNVDDESFERFYNYYDIKEKERSFVDKCLKINPNLRSNCEGLLMKTLFRTGPSTINANQMRNIEEIKEGIDGIRIDLNELPLNFK